MFEEALERVEENTEERVKISKELVSLFERFNVTKEKVAATLGLYLDVLIDIIAGDESIPMVWYREYFEKVQGYFA